jgi:ubiquinone/menaquinone biosynthesis C-methylase UbiE
MKTNTKDLYNEWHEGIGKSEDLFSTLEQPWYKTVKKLLPDDLSGKKVLEIGSGRGDFSLWLSVKYPEAHIIGTDFSSKAIELAQSKINSENKNIVFQVENAESLSFNDNSFDLIVSCETMEHIFYPQLMANEMSRVLKPGGSFILTTENYFNGMILAWIKAWLTGKPFESGSGIQPHENFFTFFIVRPFFKKAKLKIIHTESNHFQFLLLPRVNPRKLCVQDFKSPFLKRLFKPFGRHYTFIGTK